MMPNQSTANPTNREKIKSVYRPRLQERLAEESSKALLIVLTIRKLAENFRIGSKAYQESLKISHIKGS
jgi:hypothetical protein